MVPIAGGPNSRFALEIASIMAHQNEGEIVPFNVTLPGKETMDVDAFIEKECGDMIKEKIIKPKYAVSKNIGNTILEEAHKYDLIVMGASNEKALQHILHSTIPEDIARSTEKPMVMVKATGGIQSFIKKWI